MFRGAPPATLLQVQNKKRLINRLEHILGLLRKIGASTDGNRTLVILSLNDVILTKQLDFKYPFGASFLEYWTIRKELGYGMAQLDQLGIESRRAEFAALYSEIQDAFYKDIKDELLSSMERPGGSAVIPRTNVMNNMLKEVTDVLSNAIIDISIMAYNYAKGHTDNVSTVTIQLQAFKTMLLLGQPSVFTGLTKEQLRALHLLVITFIAERK